MAQGYRRVRPTVYRPRGTGRHAPHYYSLMKTLITIVVLAAIGAVVYKVLTAEVPIDES